MPRAARFHRTDGAGITHKIELLWSGHALFGPGLGSSFTTAPQVPDSKYESMFADWATTYGRDYGGYGTAAWTKAFGNFRRSMDSVIRINRDWSIPFWASGNQFSDLTFDEWSKEVLTPTLANFDPDHASKEGLGFVASFEGGSSGQTASRRLKQSLPVTTNHLAAKKVTPVRNQGQCASCWALAAATALESAYLLNVDDSSSSSTLKLSEQQMIDCVSGRYGRYNSAGCLGGWPHEAFNYASVNNLSTSTGYPFTSGVSTGAIGNECVAAAAVKPGRAVKAAGGAMQVRPARNEAALMEAVSVAPIVVGFTVDDTFQYYAGGVYTPLGCTQNLNHALVVVGYQTEVPGTSTYDGAFWILQNSWGTSWGENGVIRIKMDGSASGPCGMYQYAYMPTQAFVVTLETIHPPPPIGTITDPGYNTWTNRQPRPPSRREYFLTLGDATSDVVDPNDFVAGSTLAG
ncbi:hypothetical protein FOA52_010362 [Chlamydomonas sp. UWO 241]|nr:hypothetical protein FOA52_010362 [Chlamydomonas sp. UWO 241]